MSIETKPRRSDAFTLVEVVAAVASASVLAVTASAMLFYGFTAWRKNQLAVELQRDAGVAANMVSAAVRRASVTDISIKPHELQIRRSPTPISFYRKGTDLVYDPDTDTKDNELVLVEGRVKTFEPVSVTGGVAFAISLQEMKETTTINGVAAFRN
jgi:hypothetical protein